VERGVAEYKTGVNLFINRFPKKTLLLTYFLSLANKESLTMTVQRLLPVIALFRFDLHFGNACV